MVITLSLDNEESDFCAIVHDSAFSPRFNILKKLVKMWLCIKLEILRSGISIYT